MEYLIEAMDARGRWYIRGSDPVSGWAQNYMRQMQVREPRTAFRVLEMPARRIVVLHDPIDPRPAA